MIGWIEWIEWLDEWMAEWIDVFVGLEARGCWLDRMDWMYWIDVRLD